MFVIYCNHRVFAHILVGNGLLCPACEPIVSAHADVRLLKARLLFHADLNPVLRCHAHSRAERTGTTYLTSRWRPQPTGTKEKAEEDPEKFGHRRAREGASAAIHLHCDKAIASLCRKCVWGSPDFGNFCLTPVRASELRA